MRTIIAAATMLALAGCALTPEQLATDRMYQAKIAYACGVAMTLATAAGPLAPYIIAACASEEAIAKLALDPGSLDWISGIAAKAGKGA